MKTKQVFETKATISKIQYRQQRRDGDGICSLCFEWSLGIVDPNAVHSYCKNCDNHTLLGIDTACELGIVKVMS